MILYKPDQQLFQMEQQMVFCMLKSCNNYKIAAENFLSRILLKSYRTEQKTSLQATNLLI